MMSMIKRSQNPVHYLELLVKSQCQRRLDNMQSQDVSRCILCHEDKPVFLFCRKEISDCKNVSMGRHMCNRPVSVADTQQFFFPCIFILIWVGLINTQPCMPTTAPKEVMLGSVFRISVCTAQLFFHLPFSEYQRGGFGFSATGYHFGNLR